jgi:hypothetical protein
MGYDRPTVWHVSITGSRVEPESNEPLPVSASLPEFTVNLFTVKWVPRVRTCMPISGSIIGIRF